MCALATGVFAQAKAVAPTGISSSKLAEIDNVVDQAIKDKSIPGAVVIVGHRGKVVYRKAFGDRSLVPKVEPMTVDTIFDLASLTKVVATTTSIMKLVEDGKLRLNDTVGKYIPEIQDEQAKKITIQQLLTHVSGYAPDFDLREKWRGRDGMLQALYKEKLRTVPGVKFVYSDINFETLGELIQRLSGMPEDQYIAKVVLKDLPVTRFRRISTADTDTALIAPTENIKGQNSYLGGSFEGSANEGERILRGQVHDPTAFRMDGVAGHAGLFSNADDLARFCQMLLNGGTLDGKRILSAQTIATMTRPYVVSEDGATRGLGWDMNTSFSSNRGDLFPLGSFGHTGFTGTSVWIDRITQTYVVFLSNRVHPDGKGDATPVRAKVSTIAAAAVEDTPVEVIRLAESTYNSAVAAQIPSFIERKRSLTTVGAPMSAVLKNGTVLNGIDILIKNNFQDLEGKRIGLVTNQTGRSLDGTPTIDVLFNAKNVKLVSLFSPEHGIRGELDTEKIDDSKDEKTGLPVYSLYKDGMRRPKPEQLEGLDAIVYDIQDVGTRFYTYTATLKNVMEEAAKLGKPIYILDRPDPITGSITEGSLADEDKLNFIAAHTIPVRYGMTIGELGLLMNAERKLGADVRVIKMDGWSREMWFDQTGQTWVNPSPNMRSLTEATLYPGIGLLETTNVSVGRGTDTPFEVVGAPYIDGQKLAAYLNVRNISGVRFVPIRFTPKASIFKDEQIGGISIIITDRAVFNSVSTGIEIACALRKLYPNDWLADKYSRLLVNGQMLERIKVGETPESIISIMKDSAQEFSKRKASYLLYK